MELTNNTATGGAANAGLSSSQADLLTQNLLPPGRTRVLLVHDGSRPFGYELADLQRDGLPASVDLEILTVGDLFLSPVYLTGDDSHDLAYHYDGFQRGYSSGSFTDLDAASHEAARLVKKTFPYWSVRNTISADLAIHAVVDKATRWKPDLVMVGAADLGWFERGKLKALTRRLATEAGCSARMARPRRRREKAADRIMLALDGSRYSERALDAVLRRTWHAGSEAYLVSCIEPLITDELNWMDDYVDHDRRRLLDRMSHAKRELESVGLKVHLIMEMGSAVQTIVDEAKKHSVDAIFLGTRGLGVVGTLLTGSVSASVAARADCSVEIIYGDTQPMQAPVEHRLAA